MTINLKDLKEGTWAGVALLTERRVATAKNGKDYLDLVFSDKTGSVKCKKWDYNSLIVPALEVGKVYSISMTVSTYQGDLQGTLSWYLESDKDPKDFVKSSALDANNLYSEIEKLIDNMSEELTKDVTQKLWNVFKDKILRAPAAKGMHHDWIGGLLEHIWSMCQYAPTIVKHYQSVYKAQISLDKVIFGLCVHDLGKILEYIYETSIGYAPVGLLVPHIVIGPCWVYDAANSWLEANTDTMSSSEFVLERSQLMHIIASHHNKPEWGSPVAPSTIEAVIVHYIDNMDAKIMHALSLIEGKEGQIPGFSEKSWYEKTSYLQYTK